MPESEVTSDEIGQPNSSTRASGFSAESVSRVPLAKELVWEHAYRVNLTYAWNVRQGSWQADEARMGEVKVYTHIGFDRSGKAVIALQRVASPTGQAVEMTSAVFGNFGKEAWRQLSVLVEERGERNEAVFTNLPWLAETTVRPDPAGGGRERPQAGRRDATSMPAPNLAIASGKIDGQPVSLLADAWDAISSNRKNGTITWSGRKAPPLDLIVKGQDPASYVGVVTNVRVMAVGAFDERKLREALTKR
jgi:hypothetical protein